MKIATYNVECGGFNGYNLDARGAPPRIEAIQEVVTGLGVDVIGLTDTFRWHDIYSAADLCAMFGFDYVFTMPIVETAQNRTAQDIGITLLSNRELINPRSVPVGTRHAALAQVEQDHEGKTMVATAYLHHDDEQKRLIQASDLALHMSNADSRVVMGDLNTVNSSEPQNFVLETASRIPWLNSRGALRQIKTVLGGETYAFLLEQGLEDANLLKQPTYPSSVLPVINVPFLPALRVDHILHSNDLGARSSEVPRTELEQRASDHLPFQVELATR